MKTWTLEQVMGKKRSAFTVKWDGCPTVVFKNPPSNMEVTGWDKDLNLLTITCAKVDE